MDYLMYKNISDQVPEYRRIIFAIEWFGLKGEILCLNGSGNDYLTVEYLIKIKSGNGVCLIKRLF